MNFMSADGILVVPYSVIKSFVISTWAMVTCRSRQMIESLGEAGVGSGPASVTIGCGVVVIPGGGGAAVLEQAGWRNSPIKLLKRTSGMFFMQETKIL